MKVYLCADYDKFFNYGVHDVVRITDQQILYEYWNFWSERMIKKFGDDSELITHDNCIDDWIVVHWAWEEK